MKLNISSLNIIILFFITIISISLTQETLLLGRSSDTFIYFEFNQYKCYGKGFSNDYYWNKPYEYFYDLLSIFYCSDSYENFVLTAYLYFFWTFFIFITIFNKKFGFFETIIFIIIFFLAINPNHLVAQGRQIGSFFLFFSFLLMKNNNPRTSLVLLLFSFLAHNNTFIFSFAIYIFMNLKIIFRTIFSLRFKYKLLLSLLIFLILVFSLYSNFFNYIIKNGIYIFNAYGNLVFKDRLISSFAKYLFFAQVFSIFYIFILKVKSETVNYIANYAFILIFLSLASMIFKFNFDMMIFRLLYPVKYVFIPICFMYTYRKIIGKKCST